ncbi:MAG: hypothetical protein Q9219_006354 [cf. Caloplaca sp. 3 TL-2023]
MAPPKLQFWLQAVSYNPLTQGHDSVNNTAITGGYPTRKIPRTDLTLVMTKLAPHPFDTIQFLILLLECLYAAAEQVNQGGRAASEPVDAFQHRTAALQLQVWGLSQQLTPWKLAEAFRGLGDLAKVRGYFYGSYLVKEERYGYIAEINVL